MQTSILWHISTFLIPLFFSIILHEIAHGWVAYKCGDTTAKRSGRLTLNPISHIDPIGSILVPVCLLLTGSGIMFGWAKPVPVNFQALKDEKRDMGLVALAGPFLNFLLAFISCFILYFLPRTGGMFSLWIKDSVVAFVQVNLALCSFNLFPMLPLDGGRIVVSILPEKLSEAYSETERYGFYILLGLLFILPRIGVDILHKYMLWISQGLIDMINFLLKGVF